MKPDPTAIRERRVQMIAAVLAVIEDGGERGAGHVAVGASSPIPAAAALLARRRDPRVRVSLLGSERNNAFTDGNRELFDCAAQGRIDTFFLSGGQIDGRGRVNLVGIGAYPAVTTRFPGSFGSAFLYPLVPRVVLFREEHTPRTLVEAVDFVSAAPGTGAPGERNAGPAALVTGRGAFRFADGRLRLARLFPGETREGVAASTGFAHEADEGPLEREVASDLRAAIDAVVADDLAPDYPAFARSHAEAA